MPINVFDTPVHSILETYCFIFCEAFGSLWSLLNLYLIIFMTVERVCSISKIIGIMIIFQPCFHMRNKPGTAKVGALSKAQKAQCF